MTGNLKQPGEKPRTHFAGRVHAAAGTSWLLCPASKRDGQPSRLG